MYSEYKIDQSLFPFSKILAQYPELTGTSQSPIASTRNVFHHIDTHGPPLAERARRLAPDRLEVAKDQFRHWVAQGVCRPSCSCWAAPIHLAPKKGGGFRVCGDFRRLNSVTVPDRYPVPHIHDFASCLAGKKIFSKIDLHMAYTQIPVAPEDIEKTAVITPFGLFEFCRMIFGLKNAGQTFQRYIFQTLGDLDFVFAYIDDVLIASVDVTEHEDHLNMVFQRLKNSGLRINVDKCQFGQHELEFLGHIINPRGILPTPEKVKSVTSYPLPGAVHDLRRFLGLVNFHRRSIPHAARILEPLHQYLVNSKKRDKTKIDWTLKSVAAFEQIKNALADASLLVHPSSNSEIRLVTDASDSGMGAALEQRDRSEESSSEVWKPLAFFSRKFTPAQRVYSTFDRELTAVYESIRYFRHFLEGREFRILTDHKPLIFAFKQKSEKSSPRQQRQLSFISQFSTDIEHLSGSENVVADALSRVESIVLSSDVELKEIAEAQKDDEDLRRALQAKDWSIRLRGLPWGPANVVVYCDVSGDDLRLFVPLTMRKKILHVHHSPAHPSARVMDRMIRKHFVWPSMHKEIAEFCRHCLDCQKSKVARHTTLQPAHFVSPESRFRHIHIDIVGRLPDDQGFVYCLTIMDRFSRWPEAVPLRNMEAETVCQAFVDHWISRYGVPETVTTDQGRQFESRLFAALLRVSGSYRIRTTAYHPASNGMIERWHRSLKASIMCHSHHGWTRVLSTVLLGLRSAVMECGASAAEYLYGTTLRLPGEFLLSDNFSCDPQTFLSDFKKHMREVRPVPVAHHCGRGVFVSKNLTSCSHVFVRVDKVRKSLEPPYSGPYRIVNRVSDRFFEIEINGTNRVVSVERLKPAFVVLGPDEINNLEIPTSISTRVTLKPVETTPDCNSNERDSLPPIPVPVSLENDRPLDDQFPRESSPKIKKNDNLAKMTTNQKNPKTVTKTNVLLDHDYISSPPISINKPKKFQPNILRRKRVAFRK